MEGLRIAPVIFVLGVLVALFGSFGGVGYALSLPSYDSGARNIGYVLAGAGVVLGVLIVGFSQIVAYVERDR